MTADRLVHGIAGLIVVAAYLYVLRFRVPREQYVIIAGAALLGTWVPDWDLLIGIGYHRSPLTHSALPALLIGWLVWKWRLTGVVVGFVLGLGSHLLWDIVDYGDVRLISGGANDRLFLLVNAVALSASAFLIGTRAWPRRGIGRSGGPT